MESNDMPHDSGIWDVAVLGGALSGAAAALLLKREDPSLRIVLLEKDTAFKRRVGEATVEVSGYFLARRLGLTRFLTQTQLCKNGLRFWFSGKGASTLGECSEIGGKYLSTVPSFLIDRSVVDAEVLDRAGAEGVKILRPARVTSVDLAEGGFQTVRFQQEGSDGELRARWVIDATGVRCLLARANGWWRPNREHPTLSCWSRWSGTGDWDGAELARRHPGLASTQVGIRGTATNHLLGNGWWAWWISLKGGDTSIGVVIDQRVADWPEGDAPVGEKLRTFLSRHAAGREMLEGASFLEGDVHFRRNLPYCSEVQAGDGFVLTGDASAFLDPFYSPGMDWISFTVSSAVKTILGWRRGDDVAAEIRRHNRDFTTSYQRMFEALYRDKYDYLGECDLMRLAFRLDVGLYYLFVVRTVFLSGGEALSEPPYSHRNAWPVFRLMRLYNRRFASIARLRAAEGREGRVNAGTRDLFGGFNLRPGLLTKIIVVALGRWLLLELRVDGNPG
jgi:flavin-dependent dehydrogenase